MIASLSFIWMLPTIQALRKITEEEIKTVDFVLKKEIERLKNKTGRLKNENARQQALSAIKILSSLIGNIKRGLKKKCARSYDPRFHNKFH